MPLYPLGSVYVHDDGSLAVDCKDCGGEGDFIEHYALSGASAAPYERLHTCETCRGQGWVEIDFGDIEDDRDEDEQAAVPLEQLLRTPHL
jgi:hypothetical protein